MPCRVFEQTKVDAVVELVLTGDRKIDASTHDGLRSMMRGTCNLSSGLFVHVCANGAVGQNLRCELDDMRASDFLIGIGAQKMK